MRTGFDAVKERLADLYFQIALDEREGDIRDRLQRLGYAGDDLSPSVFSFFAREYDWTPKRVMELTAGNIIAMMDAALRPVEALDDESARIINALADAAPRLLKNVEIEADADLSKGTVTHRLAKLIVAGYVHRPNGERKGATITTKGRRKIR